jgi:hypothetical protein
VLESPFLHCTNSVSISWEGSLPPYLHFQLYSVASLQDANGMGK